MGTTAAEYDLSMMHFIADDGEPIRVQIVGSGPPLVMLHGWTASHEEWLMFIKELSRHFRLYLWDARGHGGHALLTATRPDLARMGRDLDALLRHFRLSSVTLVGHSMGALTAWEYIRQSGTNRLARLCLIDQSPKLLTDDDWSLGIYGDFDARRAQQFLASLRADFVETVLRLSADSLNIRARDSYVANTRGWQNERLRLAQLAPAPLIATWESLTQADFRSLLAHIHVPTLLVYGSHSNFYTPQTAHYVQQQMPNAVLHVYENTDHSPHLWQANRFMRDLQAFAATT